ncbi:MAG: CoA transferase [Dehalococcoidales bacterium]|nr:CoA transferase [Dehalococcoidales bacterium]
MEKSGREQTALGPYRVLDLADQTGGVYCARILAAMGADVIKVEPPGGDPTRRIGPFYHNDPHPEKSLHWFTYNLNKRSITLNIQCATGQELFKRLVKTADFVVECFRPGYLDTLGLGYAALSAINPRLILTSITPFGQNGPYSQFKGPDMVAMAASGYMFQCGDEDRPPLQISIPVADLHGGLTAAASTLIAHWYRQRTGEGQHVDLSSQESVNLQSLPSPVMWRSHGVMTTRTSAGVFVHSRSRGRPDTFFDCQDGTVFINATTATYGRQMRDWLASEGMAGELFDQKWEPFVLKAIAPDKEQAAYINGLFRAFAGNHTKRELMMEGQKRGLEIAVVQDVRDLMEDPHLQERGYWVEVEHPELNDTIVYGGAPFHSDVMPYQYYRRAPLIGEHNQEVYIKELGLTRQELAILMEGGVI